MLSSNPSLTLLPKKQPQVSFGHGNFLCLICENIAGGHSWEQKIQFFWELLENIQTGFILTKLKRALVSAWAKWEVYTHGGRRPTGIDAVKWAAYMNKCGAGEILLTSMDADGTKAGYDVELTKAVSDAVSIPVIASGGAGTTQHIVDALNVCEAALLASLLHFRELTVDDIKTDCRAQALPVR